MSDSSDAARPHAMLALVGAVGIVLVASGGTLVIDRIGAGHDDASLSEASSIRQIDTSADSSVIPASTTTLQTPSRSSAEWLGSAERFREDKRELERNAPVPSEQIASRWDLAYLTEPVEIVGPGTYELIVEDMILEHADVGYTFLPPSNAEFIMHVVDLTIEKHDTQATMKLTVEIDDFRRPYADFRIWVV